MIRKLCHHGGTFFYRSILLKDVRFYSFRCSLIASALRLTTCGKKHQFSELPLSTRRFSDHPSSFKDRNDFELKCEETLDSLAEYFDELVESTDHLHKADVNYGDGVLTVQFGEPYGTYVINRQSPNCQIWLSSPTSGPKRYDFVDGEWVYSHDGVSLHALLDKEIASITKTDVDFRDCVYGKQILGR